MPPALTSETFRGPSGEKLSTEGANVNRPEKKPPATKTSAYKPKKSDYPVFVDPNGNEHTCYLHGVSIKQVLAQPGLFEVISDRAKTIALYMDANIRSAKRMGSAFKSMASAIRNTLLNRKQAKMFEFESVTKEKTIARGIVYAEGREKQAASQSGLFEGVAEEGHGGRQQAGYRRTATGLAEGDRRDKRGLTEHDTYVSEKPFSYKFKPVQKQQSLPVGVPHSENAEKVRHAIRTRMATTGYIAGNGNVVLQAEDAASLLAGLRKHAWKNIYGINADKNVVL